MKNTSTVDKFIRSFKEQEFNAEDIDRIDSSFGYAVEGAELADNEEALKKAIKKAIDDFCDGGSVPMRMVKHIAEKALAAALDEWGL